jgi:NAD(P)-dependent dehydrogenase (short-subunit alcohol dehydrogenase family)
LYWSKIVDCIQSTLGLSLFSTNPGECQEAIDEEADMLLAGKTALITGAGNGIGRGIALRFAAEGAAVAALDRDQTACERVAAEIRSAGGRALPLAADVSQYGQVAAAVAGCEQAFGPLTTLVHNAAVMPEGTIDRTTEADWDRVFNVAVKGAFLLCREAIPQMRRARGGAILLMASITGVMGLPGLAAYSAAKGALISLARAMAIDHARDGIRVNSVSPGTVDSPMLHRFAAGQPDPIATLRAFNQVYPGGRVGTIDEVASVFAFLASDQASFVSGANWTVDGAMSVKSEQPRL